MKSKKRKFQIFIWNSKIHNAFLILLVVTLLLLSSLSYVQNLKIKELNYKLNKNSLYDDITNHNIILLDDFILENNLEGSSLGDLSEFFVSNGYSLQLGRGVLQASKDVCDIKCYTLTYRFNQKKGLYLDKYES